MKKLLLLLIIPLLSFGQSKKELLELNISQKNEIQKLRSKILDLENNLYEQVKQSQDSLQNLTNTINGLNEKLSSKNKADKSIFHVNAIKDYDDMEDLYYYSSKEDPLINKHRESGELINGTVIYFKSDPFSLFDGYVLNETTYLNGKKDGLSVKYSILENNRDRDHYYLSSEINYKNGMKNGKFLKNYPNGKIKEIGFFIDDEVDGQFKEYFDNGNLRYEGKYLNGNEVGVHKVYESNGPLLYEKYYFENLKSRYSQVKMRKNYKDGKLISTQCWNEDGVVVKCE